LPSDSTLHNEGAPRELKFFSYRYAIFRMGVFHRWEQPSDGPSEIAEEDVFMGNADDVHYHEIPLRLLHDRELYEVQDVLGVVGGHPDIEHICEPIEPTMTTADSILNTSSSQTYVKPAGSKHVGFPPAPTPIKKQTVRLNSADGLVVVSVFLPVVVQRSDDGNWSADWDYEMLLSMQTDLRVTRVGIVKWSGWHGNCGADGIREDGVPDNEREKVEACLRPFNCVPVWVEPVLFGEM
jgi:hypothetical protein